MKYLIALCLSLGLSVAHAKDMTAFCFEKAAEAQKSLEEGTRANTAPRVQTHIDVLARRVTAGRLAKDAAAHSAWSFTLGYCFGASDAYDQLERSAEPEKRRVQPQSMRSM